MPRPISARSRRRSGNTAATPAAPLVAAAAGRRRGGIRPGVEQGERLVHAPGTRGGIERASASGRLLACRRRRHRLAHFPMGRAAQALQAGCADDQVREGQATAAGARRSPRNAAAAGGHAASSTSASAAPWHRRRQGRAQLEAVAIAHLLPSAPPACRPQPRPPCHSGHSRHSSISPSPATRSGPSAAPGDARARSISSGHAAPTVRRRSRLPTGLPRREVAAQDGTRRLVPRRAQPAHGKRRGSCASQPHRAAATPPTR